MGNFTRPRSFHSSTSTSAPMTFSTSCRSNSCSTVLSTHPAAGLEWHPKSSEVSAWLNLSSSFLRNTHNVSMLHRQVERKISTVMRPTCFYWLFNLCDPSLKISCHVSLKSVDVYKKAVIQKISLCGVWVQPAN